MEPNEFDVALREQIYFEALKDYEADEAESVTDEILAVLIALLLRSGFTSFADVTKTKLNAFLVRAREALKGQMLKMSKGFVARMQNVLAVTLTVNRHTAEYTSGKKITHKDYNGTAGGNKRLWVKLTKDAVPGTGHLPLEMLKDFANTTITQMLLTVKRAYADNWTMEELLKHLKGTPEANFKDGVLRKLTNQLKHVTRTMMQHIKAFLSYNIGRMFYDKYQWLSTIDSVTTPICRARHLRIFEYGKGPVPPAHFNCRSVIVGILGNLANQAPKSFFDWIKTQPRRFLDSVLTKAEADAITGGTARAADFNAYNNVRRMTPDQFGKSAKAITT